MQDYQETVNKIIAAVRTVEEREMVLEALRALEESIYELNRDLAGAALKRILPPRLFGIFSEAALTYDAGKDQEPLKKFIADARAALDGLSELKIEFAIRPREEVINRVYEWVRREVGDRLILNADYNKTMLGGVRLTFNGRYKEFSLASMVSRVLNRERENILRKITGK